MRKNKKINLSAADSHNIKRNAKAPLSPIIVEKSVARVRQDVASWNTAIKMTGLGDNPKYYLIQQLYDEILLDALLLSQINNRTQKSLSIKSVIKNKAGDVDEEQTLLINNAPWVRELNEQILWSIYRKTSLIELSLVEDQLQIKSISRAHLDGKGNIYPDFTEDKKIPYRELREYGTWILEFEQKDGLGLLNAAVPHVLFKRFAHSCWSELAEIYGIPPRVLKTNTTDPQAMRRGKAMMEDMGAAAWFIIDDSENFDFAQGVSTNGDVYKNLINLCNSEMSMLINGAVIGQDTVNGNRSKEESSQVMLFTLIDADLRLLSQEWNTKVIPALIRIGVLKGEITHEFEQAEDLTQLWKMTTEALNHYDIKPEWIKDKFGLEVEAKKAIAPLQQNNNTAPESFFV